MNIEGRGKQNSLSAHCFISRESIVQEKETSTVVNSRYNCKDPSKGLQYPFDFVERCSLLGWADGFNSLLNIDSTSFLFSKRLARFFQRKKYFNANRFPKTLPTLKPFNGKALLCSFSGERSHMLGIDNENLI